MGSIKKNILTILFLALISGLALAFTHIDDDLDRLLARLAKITDAYPQEKVHLQFDKPYYSLGEDIWLKAYVVGANGSLFTSVSKILYVDLVNEQDSVCQTLQLPLVKGMASSNIHLSDTVLSAGNYRVYAYTKWMENFDNEFFFKKSIPVVNALRGATQTTFSYKAVAAPGGKNLDATITYTTDKSQPVSGQQVIYSLQAGDKVLMNSKGLTGADGKLNISLFIKDEFKTADLLIKTTLVNIKTGHDFVIKPLAHAADVQFFPEGGHLVNGIRTKVGFKALKPDGLGESITGYITDGGNEHLAEFKAEHAGMGIFALQPLPGKSYTAVITHEDGSSQRYPLPKADNDGYVLNVNHIGTDSLSVRVAASPALLNGKDVVILAQTAGVVHMVAKIKMDKVSNVSYVSSKKMPTGIVQFTLFSPEYQPVAERLIFIDHNDQLKAEIVADKPVYSKRGKVNLDMKITDGNGNPVVCNFSVAVVDAEKVKTDEDNETGILSNFLLTADIRGYIEQPNYYFNPANPNRLKHLDQLLLTQGWRRFNWADLQADKYPTIKYQPEDGPTVSGTITSLTGRPMANGKVTLFATMASSADPFIVDTTADANGHFVFKDLYFTDSAKVAVRATDSKDRNLVKIIIDKDPKPKFKIQYNPMALAYSDPALANYLKTTQERFIELNKFGLMKNVTALKEVKIVARKNYFEDRVIPHSVNLSPGTADIVIKPEALAKQTNLLNAFAGISSLHIFQGAIFRVGHITMLLPPKKAKSKAEVYDENPLDPQTMTAAMMVMIDGVKVAPGMIAEIPPSNVAGVEIITSNAGTAIYGNDGYWGVILVTTKRGEEDGIYVPPFNVSHFTSKGYTTSKEFYSPEYDTTPVQTAAMVDTRSTIYWNPEVVTDVNGKAQVSYFNADGTGTYKVTLEGIDFEGKLTRKTFTYVVK